MNKIAIVAIVLVLVCVMSLCSASALGGVIYYMNQDDDTLPPPPLPPVTQPPVTQPPVTQPPIAQPPVAQPPVVQPKPAPAPTPAPSPKPPSAPLDYNCGDLEKQLAKTYYETEGPFAGRYMIEPTHIAKESQGSNRKKCDIRYDYLNMQGERKGIDYRRFEFVYKNNAWKVRTMFHARSGKLVQNITGSSNTQSSNTQSSNTQSGVDCGQNEMNLAKKHFENFNRNYTMNPTQIKTLFKNDKIKACEIRYNYSAKNGSDTGNNTRKFNFIRRSYGWDVDRMSDPTSGSI